MFRSYKKSTLVVGDRVIMDNAGRTYRGSITQIGDVNCLVVTSGHEYYRNESWWVDIDTLKLDLQYYRDEKINNILD
jgi:hypothetical protein